MSKKSHNNAESAFAFTLSRVRVLFIIIMGLTSIAIMWPGYALFASATPLIFGFPLSFAWIILWVIISFAAIFGLYLSESNQDSD